MTEKDGILTFECDKDSNGQEILNSSQRNNEIEWPSKKEKPNAQYRTNWSNTCNVTSYTMALEYAGWIFPTGPYKQPEDNLAYFILTDKKMRETMKSQDPVLYDLFIKSLDGKCSKEELDRMYFPTELHKYLCEGACKWVQNNMASYFTQNYSFTGHLYNSMVKDNLPIVISTIFGGFNHIVCCTGVQYEKEKFIEAVKGETPIIPKAIIVDDPWGKYNPETNKYDAPNGGNDIIVPWDAVVKRVKPVNSTDIKWMHIFTHGPAVV